MHWEVIVRLRLGPFNRKGVLVVKMVPPSLPQDQTSGSRPFPCPASTLSTWKSFCFSATRFSKRFRAVELKERINAWEIWGEGIDGWVLEASAEISQSGSGQRYQDSPVLWGTSQRQDQNCQHEWGRVSCQERPRRGTRT